MKGNRHLLIVLFLLGCTLPAMAQFRSRMRTADKQYEIHAYNLAIQSYLEALDRRPDDTEALSRIADSYRQLNMLDEAARYYALAVRNRDVEPERLLEFGHVLKGLGRYDEARQWYQLYARDVNAMVGNHYAASVEFAKQQLATSSGFSVTPEPINTASSDFGATFATRDQVTFSSARTDLGGQFDGQARNHPFVSMVTETRFLSVPYLLRNGYRGEGSVGPVAYSPDGGQVIFTRNNFVDGTRQVPGSGMSLSLFMADVNPSGEWVNVRPYVHNGTTFNTGFATWAPDGQTIFFASDRPDGFGGYDIYRSTRVGNSWTTPENLGPVVNSPGHEITPWYDGQSLYFSSDWHHGLGGMDVFRAEQNGTRWTQIFHMGTGINSMRDDMGFVFDSSRNLGYVTSNRPDGVGQEDIYRVTRSAESITLLIRNASDGAPVAGAIIDFSDCGEGAFVADASGRYTFQAIEGLQCNVVVRKDGYASVTIPLQTTGTAPGQEVTINLNNLSETYPGKVVDYASRLPVGGVTVTATNRTTNTSVSAVTDVSGDYYLALTPYTTYDFSLRAPNYQPLEFTLPVEDGLNRNLLGVISLLPGSGSTPANPSVPATPGKPSGISSGFAVQLAAIARLPDLGNYTNMAGIGNVYYVEDGGRYKVRVGVFGTRAEAQQAQTAARSRGYSGAFVVSEAGTSGGGTTTPNPAPTTPPATSGPAYLVQLGAYSNPASFDTGRAGQLGTIVSRPKGNLTLMLVGGINSLEQARQVRQQARTAGYTGAFIVTEQGGQLTKVE